MRCDGLARGGPNRVPLACARRDQSRPANGRSREDCHANAISAAVMLLAATLSASAQGAAPPDVLKDLAPTGKLRAAINFGNGVLAQKGPNGEPKGITPDLATALAKRLGVPVEFVPYEAAGKVFEGAKAGAVGRRLHRHRAGARRRDRVQRALCHHRRHLHGAEGFAAEGGRRCRQAGHPDRGRPRLGLRSLSDAHAQERHAGARQGRRRQGDDRAVHRATSSTPRLACGSRSRITPRIIRTCG